METPEPCRPLTPWAAQKRINDYGARGHEESAWKAHTLLELTSSPPTSITSTPGAAGALTLTWRHTTTACFLNATIEFKNTGGYEFYYYHHTPTTTEDNTTSGVETHYRQQNRVKTREKLQIIAAALNHTLQHTPKEEEQ